MTVDLLTPILNDRTRSPNFFNGRLLSAEVMSEEQRAQRAARELLGQSIGDGIACGLEVEVAAAESTVQAPVVMVKSGVAVNRFGDALVLAADTPVRLLRPANTPAPSPQMIFGPCRPPQTGNYVAAAGLYLLTVCPVGAGDGLAPVSGLGGEAPRGCNVKSIIDAVEVRLIPLPFDTRAVDEPFNLFNAFILARFAQPSDPIAPVSRLRNLMAYQCFGVDRRHGFTGDPFNPPQPHTLLDDVRGTALSDCDVPLAVLYWTASQGIRFIDLWSVRRRITRKCGWLPFGLDDARLAAAEAMQAQFREHLEWLRNTAASPATLKAKDCFHYLPPAGLIPVQSGGGTTRAFDAAIFFDGKSWNRHTRWTDPIFMEGGALEALLRRAAEYPVVDLQDPEMVWLYLVRENVRGIDDGRAQQKFVVFTNAHMPFYGEPRFDRSHWSYANFV